MSSNQQALLWVTPVSKTYATLNPSDKNAGVNLTNGNLTADVNSGGNWLGVRSTISKSSWKWYWEIICNTANAWYVLGIEKSTATLAWFVGSDANWWGYYAGGQKFNGSGGVSYWASYTNDIIWVAMDLDGGTITFYKNNASQGTAFTWISWTLFAAVSLSNITQATCNFWATAMNYTAPAWYNQWLYN